MKKRAFGIRKLSNCWLDCESNIHHPFKMSVNFHDFLTPTPLPSAVFLLLSIGKFPQFLTPPPKECRRLKWMVPYTNYISFYPRVLPNLCCYLKKIRIFLYKSEVFKKEVVGQIPGPPESKKLWQGQFNAFSGQNLPHPT